MSYNDMVNSNETYTNFLTIVPRDKTYMEYTIGPIRLNVIQDDGVHYNPDIDIKVNDLNKGKKYFLNASGEGDSFKVNVIIKKSDSFQGKIEVKEEMQYGKSSSGLYGWYGGGTKTTFKKISVLDALDYWIRNMTVFMVTTRALDIPNGEYIITSNSSRKQTYEGTTIWELEFTKYTGAVTIGWSFNDTNAKSAVANYNKQKKANAAKAKAAVKTKVKQQSSIQKKLSKCKLCSIKYSKKKKTCICTLYMQHILKKKGYYNSSLDGWFGSETTKAVKKFQNAYKKKYNLKKTGKVDSKTKSALCKV